MDVKKFRKKYHLASSDIVRLIRYRYPKFGKGQLSMVSNPDDYGVILAPGAEDILRTAVAHKKVNRKKNHQLTVRVEDDLYDAIVYVCAELNITMQELLESAVFRYLSV